MRKLGKLVFVAFVNISILLSLLVLLELFYRIYLDGFTAAIAKFFEYPAVPYSNLGTSNLIIYDEELGYRLNPNRENINSLSIRHHEISTPKPEQLFRIVFLGDSIPWDRSGFVSQLQSRLDTRGSYEVINASVPGYTSYQELRFFERYVSKTDPDLVIWTYCLNDNHKFLHRFDERAQMLWTREAEESLRNSPGDKIISRSYLLNSLRLRFAAVTRQVVEKSSRYPWEGAIDFNIAWKDYSWNSYEQHLKKMVRMLRERGVPLTIIIFPYEPQLDYRNATDDYAYVVKPQRILVSLCKKYQVPCLDLLPPFSEWYDQGKKLFRDRIHLNDTGHRVTTAMIEQFLINNRLLERDRLRAAVAR